MFITADPTVDLAVYSCDQEVDDDTNRELERARRREIAGYLTAASFPANIASGLSPTPHTSSDPVLNALVQIGPLRLDCDRSFLSLIDADHQFIVTEMTRTHPLTGPSTTADRIFLGCCKLDPEYGVCPLTMRTFMDRKGKMVQKGPVVFADNSKYIISDFRALSHYENRPYVTGYPYMVSYLEVPLVSPLGYILGSYCVVDNKLREFNDDFVIGVMRETASAIMHHLNSMNVQQRLGRADNLISGLSGFAGDMQTIVAHRQRVKGNSTSQGPSINNVVHSSHDLTIEVLADPGSPDSLEKISTGTSTDDLGLETKHSTCSSTTSDVNDEPSEGSQEDPKAPNDADSKSSQWHSYIRNHLAVLEDGANLIRKALNLDGLVFLDAVTSKSNRSHARPNPGRYASCSSNTTQAGPTNQLPSYPKILAKSIGERDSFGIASPAALVPESTIQKLIQCFPQGAIFTADEQGPIMQAYAPGVKIDMDHEVEGIKARTDESALFDFLPQARYILFMPLWHFQRDCWYTAMLAWNIDSLQAMDNSDLQLLAAYGSSLTSKIAYFESQTMNQVKSDFIASISHELRSPLHGILASSELLREHIDDPDALTMVDMIDSCGSTLLDTFNNLLDHARINGSVISAVNETKKADTGAEMVEAIASDLATVDLGDLVEEVVAIVELGYASMTSIHKGPIRSSSNSSVNPPKSPGTHKDQNENAAVTVTVNIESGVDWTLELLVGAWKRIVMNLTGNALKYTKRGSIEVNLSTKIATSEDGVVSKCIYFSVRDSGIGMSPTYLRYHLFTSFAQENPIAPGSGLGLSLVKQLVQGLGGHIEVDSHQGSGTLVEVSVPVMNPDVELRAPLETSNGHFKCGRQLRGKHLCYLSTNSCSDTQEVKRLQAVQLTITNIAESNGMHVTIVESQQDFPSADVYFLDNDMYHGHEVGPGSNNEEFSKLLPLILLDSRPASNSRGRRKQDLITNITSPISPKKIRLAFLGAIETAELALANPQDPFESEDFSLSQTEQTELLDQRREREPELPARPSDHETDMNDGIPRLHILLVDDNAINLKILIALMDKLHQTFESATDGLQAVESFESSISTSGKPFDIIFMDISMPILNGFEATRRIRDIESKTNNLPCQIFALTGLGSESAQMEASDSGFDKFLKKPFQLKEIAVLLEEAAQQRKAETAS